MNWAALSIPAVPTPRPSHSSDESRRTASNIRDSRLSDAEFSAPDAADSGTAERSNATIQMDRMAKLRAEKRRGIRAFWDGRDGGGGIESGHTWPIRRAVAATAWN